MAQSHIFRRFSLDFPKHRLPRFKPLPPSYSSSLEPSLSARMSFVFDQMDELEKQRSDKDQTLHRIRAWRDSKKAPIPQPNSKSDEPLSSSPKSAPELVQVDEAKGMVQFVHPWPEWIDLMEKLVQHNYFDHRRIDEDQLITVAGFNEDSFRGSSAHHVSGAAFKNFRAAHDAFINLGEDRFDIFRSIAVQDILALVGFGCPTNDKRVVFSSKFLRKYLQLEEGDVCSRCSLRHQCPGAFKLATTEDEARSLDIMRVLFTYGCDPLDRARMNPSVVKHKSVTAVARKLLRQVVRLISVPIDPSLPRPPVKIPIPKVKKPPPPPRRRVGRADIEMKEGDWICPKCDFMNFSKNQECLQCDEKRPKRLLLPGEWECPQCDFLNYRRNTLCFNCDHQRPPDEYTENKMQETHQTPRMRPKRINYRPEGIKAWNFDFDDDESDGADVSAFEYADSSAAEKGLLNNPDQGGISGRPKPDLNRASRDVRGFNEEYSDDEPGRPRNGFDDFADEEDVTSSYKIKDDTPVKTRMSSNDFSGYQSEAIAESNNVFPSSAARSNHIRRKALSGSDDFDSDSDSEVSARPNPRRALNPQSNNKQSQIMPERRAFFCSDDDGLDDMDDSPSRNFESKQTGGICDNIHGRSPRMMRTSFFNSEDKDEDFPLSYGNRSTGRAGPRRGAGNLRGRGSFDGRRINSFDEDDDDDDDDENNDDEHFRGSSRGFRGIGSAGKGGGLRMNNINGRSGGRRYSFDDDDDDFRGSSERFRGRGPSNQNSWSRTNDGNGRTRSSGFGKRDFNEH